MIFIISVVAILIVWAFVIEPRWLKIRRLSIKLKTPLKRPVTLLHISDTHFPLHYKTLSRFFNQMSRLLPDFIVLTGDIIDNNSGISPCVQAVSKLRSRMGTYAVLGNHDHYDYNNREVLSFLFGKCLHPQKRNDVAGLKKGLAEAGCTVLTNENVSFDIEGQKLCLIGLDDPVTRQANPDLAFQNVNGAAVKILLTHSIDILMKMDGSSADLVLGGHTHGGQVSVPFFGPMPLKTHCDMGRRFIAGLNRYRGMITYTSRGTGEGKFFPFRFLCRPEAVLFEIQ